MASHCAAVLSSFDSPLEIKSLETPKATAGNAIVRVLSTPVSPDLIDIFQGHFGFQMKFPLTVGGFAIGRVQEVGSDATSLQAGQLVLVGAAVRGRDDTNKEFLMGLHAGFEPATQKLMDDEWRHGTWADIVKAPLESLYALDEDVLLRQFEYSFADLTALHYLAVAFGGLATAGVKPGDRVIVAPATGTFSGAAVPVALALGAQVIALGRNKEALFNLQSSMIAGDRLTTVTLQSDGEKNSKAVAEAAGPKGADVYIDFTPHPAFAQGTPVHITASVNALRPGGTCVLMGGSIGDITLPQLPIIFKKLKILGMFMYEPWQMQQLIKMIERGVLKLRGGIGLRNAKTYDLDHTEDALQDAKKHPGWGYPVAIEP